MRVLMNKIKNSRSRIVATIVVAVLLCVIFLAMMAFVYKSAENEGKESLHVITKEIREDINLQMVSDRENLQTMARFAAKLYSDGESYDLLFNSYEKIGLIENIGILTADNMLLSKAGRADVSTDLNFADEVEKVPYVSGRIKDITNTDEELVRSAVPIKLNDKIVAILYGVIDLDTLYERYYDSASKMNARLFVLERGTGNFIIDTKNKDLGNLSSLTQRKYNKGFSYSELAQSIYNGEDGFSAFNSKDNDIAYYVHYAPLDIGDWQIMLAMPEETVFDEARKMGMNMTIMFLIVVCVMIAYLILIFASERRMLRMNLHASNVRRLLLEVNQRTSSMSEALENLTSFAKSRSAFFVDTDGEDYSYINPLFKNKKLSGEDKQRFVFDLFCWSGKHSNDKNVAVNTIRIVVNNELKKSSPEFYEFLTRNKIKNITFASVVNMRDHISILGVINENKHNEVKNLLDEIAVCFSMAVYNKKYLAKTETVAATDSLTGVNNRMAYKRDVVALDAKMTRDLSCIYIDVNELHIINNKHGHAAGDGMLLFIAKTLKELFDGQYIYRMGGDEFLVFVENCPDNEVSDKIELLHERLKVMNYHVSVGMAFCKHNKDTEAMVKAAEKRMYEAKALYYQQKEQKSYKETISKNIDHIKTGIAELDAILSILSQRYMGIYCVSLKTDQAREILIPAYLKELAGDDRCFSRIFGRYIQDMASPDYQRPLLSFLRYDVIEGQLAEGNIPSISYEKANGGKFRLSVYPIGDATDKINETIWIFEKES